VSPILDGDTYLADGCFWRSSPAKERFDEAADEFQTRRSNFPH
jgi:hypothetical protein